MRTARRGPLTDDQVSRFKRLAWPCLPVVLRVAKYLMPRADVAEDLAQETMMKAMRAIDRFQEGTDARSWLLRILRNTRLDWIRAEQKRAGDISLDQAELDPPELEPAGVHDAAWTEPEQMMERFEDEAIIAALKNLPEEIRWTLLLVDIEQLDQAEAADILGIPVGTVKSRAHRGRAMLRDRLADVALKRGWLNHPQEGDHAH